MKLATTVLGTICAILCIPALAAEGRWTEGFGQGNLEYFIDVQGMRLLIGCPTQEGSADAPSSINLQRVSDGVSSKQFSILANGITYDAPFSADSRVGANNFLSLLAGLRKGDAIVKLGNKSITFPRSNAAKVIPVHGKGFSCNLM